MITPENIAGEIAKYTQEHLGPASERALMDPAAQTRILAALRCGTDFGDAVLAEIHRAAPRDRRIADEFLAHFLCDLMRIAQVNIFPCLRRYLSTGDLVNSVLGDLWERFREVRFETRSKYLAYLSQALRWKHSNKLKATSRETRGGEAEGVNFVQTSGGLDSDTDPGSVAILNEERKLFVLILPRMQERDREILMLYLRDWDFDQIAMHLDIKVDAARRRLERAVKAARRLL